MKPKIIRCKWCEQGRIPKDGRHHIVTVIGNRPRGEYVKCEKAKAGGKS